MPAKNRKPAMIIGWREWIRFPDFDNVAIKAKIDTGAQTSAIHAWNIKTFSENGEDIAQFDLHPLQDDKKTIIRAKAPIVDCRNIKSSNGQTEERIVISTQIEIAGRTWPVELTLSRRDEMGYRMLLGRTAMKNQLIVDPSKSFCAGDYT